MSELSPRNSDLVLGGQNPPPITAAVLGGLAGIEQQLSSESTTVRLQALNNTIRYGKNAIDLLIQSLADPAEEVRQLTNKLLDDLLDTAQKNELFRVLASDADPQLLIEIARSNDLITLKYLAGNCNTPPDVLSRLGNIDNLEKILAINIQEWSKLKHKIKLNPSHLGGYFGDRAVNLETHYQKLADSGISIEIIETVEIAYAIEHPMSLDETLIGIAKNPNTHAHILGKIATYREQIVVDTIWFREDTKKLKYQLGRSIAEHPNTPEELRCKIPSDSQNIFW